VGPSGILRGQETWELQGQAGDWRSRPFRGNQSTGEVGPSEAIRVQEKKAFQGNQRTGEVCLSGQPKAKRSRPFRTTKGQEKKASQGNQRTGEMGPSGAIRGQKK
jgi:hypothetical protein